MKDGIVCARGSTYRNRSYESWKFIAQVCAWHDFVLYIYDQSTSEAFVLLTQLDRAVSH